MRADLRSIEVLAKGSLWSEWTNPDLTRLACGTALKFVQHYLPQAPARILEIGSGNGYLSLELARAGYEVTGLEPSSDALAIARASAAPGLTYVQERIESFAPDLKYDAVICNRSLHHLPDLPQTVQKIAHLAPRIVCREFTRDTFDTPTATWLLHLAGLADDPEQFVQQWHQPLHEHQLHGKEAMLSVLRACYKELFLEPIPCYWVYAANANPTTSPGACMNAELTALGAHTITPGAFSFVGVTP